MTTVTAERAAPIGRMTQLASSRSCSARASPVSQQAVTARKSTIPAARRRPLGGSGDEGELSTNDPAEYLRHAEDKEGPHLRAFLRSSGPGSVTVERAGSSSCGRVVGERLRGEGRSRRGYLLGRRSNGRATRQPLVAEAVLAVERLAANHQRPELGRGHALLCSCRADDPRAFVRARARCA